MRLPKHCIRNASMILLQIGSFIVFCTPATAQSPVKNTGNVRSVKITGQTVNITTDNAFATITVYSPDIVRVRIDKQKLKEDLSYAVVMQPAKIAVKISEDDKQLTILTDSLKVKVFKSPFAVSFLYPG